MMNKSEVWLSEWISILFVFWNMWMLEGSWRGVVYRLWIGGFSSQINSDKLSEGEIQNSSLWRWENIDPVYKFQIPYPRIHKNAKCFN